MRNLKLLKHLQLHLGMFAFDFRFSKFPFSGLNIFHEYIIQVQWMKSKNLYSQETVVYITCNFFDSNPIYLFPAVSFCICLVCNQSKYYECGLFFV